MFVKPCIKFSL